MYLKLSAVLRLTELECRFIFVQKVIYLE